MARRLHMLLLRMRSLFHYGRMEEELDEELRFHLEYQIQEYIAQGMSPEEARWSAMRDLGGLEQHKEECRDARGLRWLEFAWRDFCFGLRMMRRNPGFTTIAVITLALGIAGNTAAFSIVDAVLVRPLPYIQSDRIVRLAHTPPRIATPVLETAISDALRETSSSFSSVAVYSAKTSDLNVQDRQEQVTSVSASPSLFRLLGVSAAYGRLFTDSEGKRGESGVILISDRLWRRCYGGNMSILGNLIILDDRGFIVIGIMPPQFNFPDGRGEVWLLQSNTPSARMMPTVARLREGSSIEQARAEISSLIKSTGASEIVNAEKSVITVVSLREEMIMSVRPALLLVFCAVLFVLMIACANLANLTAARARHRGREFAIRASLGASRWQLVRQSLIESCLLSVTAGGLGLILARWLIASVMIVSPIKLRTEYPIGIDWRTFAFLAAVSISSGITIGLAAVFERSRTNLIDVIHKTCHGTTHRSGFPLGNGAIVTGQVAVGVALLLAGGLMIRSFIALITVDLGYQPDKVLTAVASFPRTAAYFVSKQQKMQHILVWNQLSERLAKQPEVEAVGIGPPALSSHYPSYIYPEGWPENEPAAGWDAFVNPGYFKSLGLRLLKGRLIADRDTQLAPEMVAVINETLAKRYFPGVDPIGKTISSNQTRIGGGGPRRIVGVVADVRHSNLDPETLPYIYYSWNQPSNLPLDLGVFLCIRAHGNPEKLIPMVRTQIAELDRTITVNEIKTLDARIWETLVTPRFFVILMGGFALSAFLMVVLGVYGVVTYLVSHRSHEMGIRIALGAGKKDILTLILWQSLKPVILGASIGLAASFSLSRLISSLLYGIRPHDIATFVVVPLVLLLSAALASYLPARRATIVDPVAALKEE